MLANQGSLFQIWQIPFILVFIAAWIFGGGFLFRKTFSRFPENKRMTLARGILVSLLSGMLGSITAAIVFKTSWKVLDMPIVSLIIAVPFFVIMAYLVVFSMFKHSAWQTLRASLLPLGAILVLAGVIGSACGIPAIATRRAFIKEQGLQIQTAQNLHKIFGIISSRPEKLPESLEELLKIKDMNPDWLKSPANPSRKIGFFYLKPDRISFSKNNQKILACDFGDNFANFPEQGRVVLYTHGNPRFLPSSSFASLLKNPENKEFAEALKKSESK